MQNEFHQEQVYLSEKHNVKYNNVKIIEDELNDELLIYIKGDFVGKIDQEFYNEFLGKKDE